MFCGERFSCLVFLLLPGMQHIFCVAVLGERAHPGKLGASIGLFHSTHLGIAARLLFLSGMSTRREVGFI